MVLSIVVRAPLGEETGVTADLIESSFDRVYVAPDLDADAVLSGLDSAYRTEEGRVVPMTYLKPQSGSYAVVPVK